MKTFKFRVYCEIEQDGTDRNDACNRLELNVYSPFDDEDGRGAVVLRQVKGRIDPVYPATFTRMMVLGAELMKGSAE